VDKDEREDHDADHDRDRLTHSPQQKPRHEEDLV
jgi:hypothetical protein